jgi:lactate dehydrogenase-like 2-hydroxyacid dehydrogenase
MTTFLVLLLFAVIFLAAGGALLYFRNKNKQKAALMGRSLGKTVRWLGVGGIGAIVVGIALLAIGLFVLIG